MTKMTNKKAKTKGQAGPARRTTAPPSRILANRTQLDEAARQWARVLEDPCNAPLAYPCYPTGGGGSVLMRFESDVVWNSGATETAGVLFWTPAMNYVGINNTPLTNDTLGTVMNITSNNTPGVGFLSATPHSKRCVAACIQVSFPGTELNRSGIIGLGITDGSAFANNIATGNGGNNINLSAGTARTMCQHVERVPQGVSEIKWYPGEQDAVNISPNSLIASSADQLSGHNVLVATWSGIPAATGMRIRMVMVTEVTLQAGNGTVATALPPVSYNTPNQIVRSLFAKDPTWFLETATKAGKVVGSVISYANQGRKALQAFSTAAGLLL